MSILEQDFSKKKQKNKTLPEPEREFKARNNKEYTVELIIDNVM